MTIEVQKLNESYSIIDGPMETLMQINDFLKVERPGAYFDDLVKRGFKSPYDYFTSVQHKKLLVMNGHLELLNHFGIQPHEQSSDFTDNEISEFLKDIKTVLPFEPYDFQETAFRESLKGVKQINRMCTSSGKSMTISLLMEFFRQRGMKGLLLVPNINLLTQFKSDIKDYNLIDLWEDTHTIGGGQTERHFNNSLTISTWQSLQDHTEGLDQLDYVICDETHRFASDVTASIVKGTVNCRYKWGFTGTLPEDPCMKMELFGLFGLPKTYITASELIERGLATPIKINSIIFNYNDNDKKLFKEAGQYPKQVQFLKEHVKRNEFIVNLSTNLRPTGNTLILGSHIEHLKMMYLGIMKKIHPEITEIPNKLITGKNSFEFQKKHGIYYISGTDDAKTREKTRKILEEDLFIITLENDKQISLHGFEKIKLMDGTEKLVSDLTESDEINVDDF